MIVSDVNEEAGRETVQMIKDAGDGAEFYFCDVTEETQVKAMVDETLLKFGSLDFAHNNAGVSLS